MGVRIGGGVIGASGGSYGYLLFPIETLPITTIPKPPGVPNPLTANNNSGGTTVTVPGGSMRLASAPVANFDYYLYAGQTVGFMSRSVGLISSYLWNFGDGATSRVASVIHQYQNPGTYYVTLTVANYVGTSTKFRSVVVVSSVLPETVDYTYITSGFGVQFTDISTKPGDRVWSFGDGKVSMEASPYHHYSASGIYSVSLSINGTTVSKQISVDYAIMLNWVDNSSDETGFSIEHSLNVSSWSEIATVGAGVTTLTVTYNIHGVDPSVLNYFRVAAYGVGGDSGYTNTVQTLCGA